MGKKILLADDSITIQKVIELTFSDEDFEVVTVGNGRLAIERVQEVRPDVVLCDVIMPEKNGYEVCDFIKKSPQFGAIPVLLLTGAFEPFDQEQAARVGCDGFLAKPFEPETLIAKVKDLLSKAAARQSAPAMSEPAAARFEVPPAAVASTSPFAGAAAPTFSAPPVAAASPFAAAPVAPAFAPVEPPQVVEEPEMAFIPDEPFEDLDTPSFDSPDLPASEPDSVESLLPITSEESETLSGSGSGDASATVMFRADSMPWSTPPSPPAPTAPTPHEPEGVAELPVFEEVIEETEVEATIPSFVPSPAQAWAPVPPPQMVAPAFVVPPPVPAPLPAPVLAPPVPAVAPPPPPPPALAPPPVTVVAPPAPPPQATPAPVPMAPRMAATPVYEPLPEPAPPAPVAPEASSFADVAAAIQEPEDLIAPSLAAQVDVPVDMVAQIAQRVVAQVSEKVVERIAWEVIPDLAEALIKREIERLKAEIQQL